MTFLYKSEINPRCFLKSKSLGYRFLDLKMLAQFLLKIFFLDILQNKRSKFWNRNKFATNNPSRFAFLKACRPVDESSSLNSPSSTSSDSSTRATNDEEIQGIISRMSGDHSSSSQDEESDSAMRQARELVAKMFQVQNPS